MRAGHRSLTALLIAGGLSFAGGCGERRDIQGAMTADKDNPGGAAHTAEKPPAPGTAKETPPARGTYVEVMEVTPREFVLSATYIGHLLPRERVELRAELEGVVESATFAEGDAIQRGAVLVNVSTGQLKVRRDLARSELALAESNFQRDKRLHGKRLIPDSRLEQSRNRRDVAKYTLRLAEIELDKSAVKTPISGTVKTKAVEVGEFLNKGQLIAEILDISKVRALFHVPEREIRHLSPGMRVAVSFDALPGASHRGVVKTVGLEADRKSRTFPVEVELDNPQRRLLPGMLARVRVRLATHRRQVLVPRYAVLEREAGRAVFVARNGQAEERFIETGADAGEEIQVLNGLSFGDQLVVAGQQMLTDNEPIEIRRVVR